MSKVGPKIMYTIVLAIACVILAFIVWFVCWNTGQSSNGQKRESQPPVIHVNSKEALEQLMSDVNTVIFDCDGVLYIGTQVLKGK